MTIALTLFQDSKDFQTFAPGEMVFEEGQIGEVMYVIIEGEVEILSNDSVVDTLKPGDIFGEMALIDSSPRSADAIARTECKIVPVDQYAFTHYVQHSPFFSLHVMAIMANRLRRYME